MHIGMALIVLGAVARFAIEADVTGVNLDVMGLILIVSGMVAALVGIAGRVRRRSLAPSPVGAQHSSNTAERSPVFDAHAGTTMPGALRPAGTITERIHALPRMLRAAREGSYLGLPRHQPMLWLLSALYVVSPIDIIPDLLPLLGAADDAGVLLWLLTSVMGETGRFLSWERSRTMISPRGTWMEPRGM